MRLHKSRRSHCLFITSLPYYASGCLGTKRSALIGFGFLCKLRTVNWLPNPSESSKEITQVCVRVCVCVCVCVCSQTQRRSCCIRSRQTLHHCTSSECYRLRHWRTAKPSVVKSKWTPFVFHSAGDSDIVRHRGYSFHTRQRDCFEPWSCCVCVCVWMGILSMVQPSQGNALVSIAQAVQVQCQILEDIWMWFACMSPSTLQMGLAGLRERATRGDRERGRGGGADREKRELRVQMNHNDWEPLTRGLECSARTFWIVFIFKKRQRVKQNSPWCCFGFSFSNSKVIWLFWRKKYFCLAHVISPQPKAAAKLHLSPRKMNICVSLTKNIPLGVHMISFCPPVLYLGNFLIYRKLKEIYREHSYAYFLLALTDHIVTSPAI